MVWVSDWDKPRLESFVEKDTVLQSSFRENKMLYLPFCLKWDSLDSGNLNMINAILRAVGW